MCIQYLAPPPQTPELPQLLARAHWFMVGGTYLVQAPVEDLILVLVVGNRMTVACRNVGHWNQVLDFGWQILRPWSPQSPIIVASPREDLTVVG